MRGAIILTIQFDERSDGMFQELRRRHFPPQQNRVGAHLTLFHNLPGTEEKTILKSAAKAAATTAPFAVSVEGPMRLGRGVALKIGGEPLSALRARLAASFGFRLSAQDREKFRPHVTIQNKAAPHEAAALFEHLAKTFAPFDAIAEGVQLWRYAGGPWAPIAAIPFQGAH